MNNSTQSPPPDTPARPRQFTYRLYDPKRAERFDSLTARFGGRTGAALDAVFDAGLNALAPAAPDSATDSRDAIAKKLLTQPAAVCDSALNQLDSPAPTPAALVGLGAALGGLALAVSVTALAVALYRTPATPAIPAATPPDLSAYATKADLADRVEQIDMDLTTLGAAVGQQKARLDKLSAATPPGRQVQGVQLSNKPENKKDNENAYEYMDTKPGGS